MISGIDIEHMREIKDVPDNARFKLTDDLPSSHYQADSLFTMLYKELPYVICMDAQGNVHKISSRFKVVLVDVL
jgi:hypothetical protein